MVCVQALKAIGDATYLWLSVKVKQIIIIIENEREKSEQHAMRAISREMSSATNEESLPHTEPYSQLIDSNVKKRMYIREKNEWPSMTFTWAVHHRIKIDI